MGWKNVKEHYRIGHIVQVRDGAICIGSPYIPDIIVIGLDGAIAKRCDDHGCYEDLRRYMKEFEDGDTLRRLVTDPDVFERSLPVYTYNDGVILEKQCESYGWPNVTHDGCIQYENTFFADKLKVVALAKRDVQIGLKWDAEAIAELEQRLAERRDQMERRRAALDALERKYPDVKADE